MAADNNWQPVSRRVGVAHHKGMTTTAPALRLHPDRLLPPDPQVRTIARRLYDAVRDLPILSPTGRGLWKRNAETP